MRACYLAFVSQAIINNLAPLLFVIFQNRFSLSFERIGWLIMANFGTQLLVDSLCIKFADKIGHRRLMVAAHALCGLGLVFLGVLPGAFPSAYLGLLLAVVTYAVGGGLIEVLAGPVATALPGEDNAASMSLLHSFYCWGHACVVLLTAAFFTLFGQEAWRALPMLWAVIPAYNAVRFSRVPFAPLPPARERLPLKKLLGDWLFVCTVLMMVCAGASEQAMGQWASLFAEKGLRVSKVTGDLLGPCLFAVCMGAGRTLFGVAGEKILLSRALAVSASLCAVCYWVAALSANPFAALIGCAATGLCVSLLWPGMISLGARAFRAGGTAVFSLLALGGDLGCSVGPWLTGMVSDAAQASPRVMAMGARAGLDTVQTGLKSGLLAATLFPAGLFLGMIVIGRAVGKKRG